MLSVPPEHDLALAEEDLAAGLDDGLESGSAQPIDGDGRCLDGEAGLERHVTGAVDRVARGLERVPEDHVVDVVGRESRAIDRRLGGHHAQVVGGEVLQRAAEGPEAVRTPATSTMSSRSSFMVCSSKTLKDGNAERAAKGRFRANASQPWGVFPVTMPGSDRDLVKAALRGRTVAFEALVRRHLRSAYAVALARTGKSA